MIEKRYAILIGMDNYPKDALLYCVKDVQDIEDVLISRCDFQPNNIYKIIDNVKPIKQQIDEAFSKIEENFVKKQDLLLFYFSGHGRYDKNERKSKIIFEDNTELTMEDILLRYFYKIAPKNQYLLIDACYSGAGIHFKGNNNQKEVRRLNYNSNELCLMFATESKNKAIQHEDIKNSYFTYFLIEAIKNDKLYDEDGFLTMQVIDNYLRKKVLEKSEYLQIPVSETRSSGYKIFSNNKKKSKVEFVKNELKINQDTKEGDKEMLIEDSLNEEHRNFEQEKYSKIIDEKLSDFSNKIDSAQFAISIDNPFLELSDGNAQKIYKRVIEKAQKDDLEAIYDNFEIEYVEKKQPDYFGGLGSIANLLFENSKPEYKYKIYTSAKGIYCNGLACKAKNIYEVSCGLAMLIFQVKYGFVISIIHYNLNWDGNSHSKLENINVTFKAYRLNVDNSLDIVAYLSKKLEDFESQLIKMLAKRKKDIDSFLSKTNTN